MKRGNEHEGEYARPPNGQKHDLTLEKLEEPQDDKKGMDTEGKKAKGKKATWSGR